MELREVNPTLPTERVEVPAGSCQLACTPCAETDIHVPPVSESEVMIQSGMLQEELRSTKGSDAKCHADAKGATIVLENDLQTAIEVNCAGEMKVLYPKNRQMFITSTSEMVMQVSLRDDPTILGCCQVLPDAQLPRPITLRVSESFGSFGADAREFLQREQQEIHREQKLRDQREEIIQKTAAKHRCMMRVCALGIVVYCLLYFVPLVELIFRQPTEVAGMESFASSTLGQGIMAFFYKWLYCFLSDTCLSDTLLLSSPMGVQDGLPLMVRQHCFSSAVFAWLRA
eukprot:Skav212228  [mRNA]  locus=scaffold4279:36436:37293:+ [translate_table: standard]